MRASFPCSKGEGEHEDPSKFITDPLNQEIPLEPNTPDPKLLINKNAPDSNLLQHTSSNFSMFILYCRKLLRNCELRHPLTYNFINSQPSELLKCKIILMHLPE
uniref:Putative ovule protein n=1 Tax=Solanum chacoense TaxID=4108 RepID=A0A0V0HKZ8_SOLCH